MLEFRSIETGDAAVIRNWPPYPAEFSELDYTLRDDGWLAEYRYKPDTLIYVAKQRGELVAFSLLSRTGNASAEFRIALRADRLGRGLGKTVAALTLAQGFSDPGLNCIHLIVRKNNIRAQHLYRQLGFREKSGITKHVNGSLVDFIEMNISKSENKGAATLLRNTTLLRNKGAATLRAK